jgi:phage gp29-like protein
MKTPLFLKNADQLDHWLERFNPLQGATLGTLSGYFEEADEGRYAQVMWLARKLARRDATIRACLKRINATVQQLDWTIKTIEELPPGVTPQMAEAQSAYLKERYSAVENLTAAYSWLAKADFFGFAHLEKHYNAAGQVCRLEPVPQWHWCKRGFYGEWLYNAKARPWAPEAVPIEKGNFIIHEVEDPWLEIACISGLDRNQLRRDLRGFCARYGIPNTFFIAGPGATDGDMDALNSVAVDMAADGTGALPPGADVKVHESASKGEIFEMADKAFQSEIVLAATGGLLTMLTSSGSGTLAGGAHSDTWRDLVSGIAMAVTECFQEQMDKALLSERFPGQPVLAYFELEFPEAGADMTALATTIKALSDAGYKADAAWVSEETGIPLTGAAVVDATGKPLTNRFRGGPSSARDRAEAESLVTAAIADALDVMTSTVRPLSADIAALIALAEDDKATAAEFSALAEKVSKLLPELMTADTVKSLASEMEKALGSAAVLGARKAVRKKI